MNTTPTLPRIYAPLSVLDIRSPGAVPDPTPARFFRPDPVALARQLVAEMAHIPDDIAAQVAEVLEPLTADQRTLDAELIEDLQADVERLDDDKCELEKEVETLRSHINKWEVAYDRVPDKPTGDEENDNDLLDEYLAAVEKALVEMTTLYHADV